MIDSSSSSSSSPALRRRLVVFARAPEAGRVKTRLAAELGPDDALAIYRWLGARTLSHARAVRACELEVRYTPMGDRDAVAGWLGDDLTLHPQADGDLGSRMQTAIVAALADGAPAVVVVGTDCPGLDADIVERAFDALGQADVVLGPALDGGYYLIAVRAVHDVLFDHIPWSSPETLARTLGAATAAGLRVALLETHGDIDTADDWRRWVARSAEAPELAERQLG
jgi:rSAM/selenodomain-associated transferase 1